MICYLLFILWIVLTTIALYISETYVPKTKYIGLRNTLLAYGFSLTLAVALTFIGETL